MYSVVLLSGGKGSRMQEDTPKQYLLLAGKPMIMHSLERVDRLVDVDEIVVVCAPSYRHVVKQMVHEYNVATKIVFVDAGQTRQESVYNGLKAVHNEFVIIHEAARPFVKQEEFQALIDDEEFNVIYGYNISYTVLKGHGYVSGILDRSELLNVQLPQKFKVSDLIDAHDKAKQRGDVYTEDASLMFANSQKKIKVIRGTSFNIKITEPIDLLLGEIIYKDYIINRK
ncbi:MULTISPECIES: 2-C-methyl-D-erythritol 4-phosphate cytidylyltransferase [Butyricimonas]|uniref:2-C-methyl-D-erythritol 4-phosphate cytidylyltransferase n=1 Tax=Butyricimonas TaxID=574697 RepID=UPI001D077D29|nr:MULTISPECIES: 2-C-methyl-D-erythritol 4-phosphate cytidylyltransferase [Butyricimonas]MCB6974825.1 2-C-methyl-D-erythritol 4-phosphate cytidylyltransferase [Butyricimonas synergistica]MCG4521567.1 2-C-methyl-D-erythritol 4-phosphate cytidylyltransferase [Butyricimonas sp. DFI.6.44]